MAVDCVALSLAADPMGLFEASAEGGQSNQWQGLATVCGYFHIANSRCDLTHLQLVLGSGSWPVLTFALAAQQPVVINRVFQTTSTLWCAPTRRQWL
jgi:hypothetical protein